MLVEGIGDLTGVWRRSLLVTAAGERDEVSEVAWVQGAARFGDLRQPGEARDFSHVRGVEDLGAEDCAWLARQAGFAGVLRVVGDCVEWVRVVDFQPEQAVKDVGRLSWEGDVLVEVGRDVSYVEHWRREAGRKVIPVGAVALLAADGRRGALVRVGDDFVYARGRAAALPAGRELAALVREAADLAAMRALVDCEISVGVVGSEGWRVARSSLPWRVGVDLAPRLGLHNGFFCAGAPAWRVMDVEGDVSAFLDVSV